MLQACLGDLAPQTTVWFGTGRGGPLMAFTATHALPRALLLSRALQSGRRGLVMWPHGLREGSVSF